MSGTHTPGPWKLKREGTICDANGDLIATTGYRVTAVDDQDAPNGRLIAASPCLYEALARILALRPSVVGTIDHAKAFSASLDAARAALAKARGKVSA